MRVLVCGGRDFGHSDIRSTPEEVEVAKKQRRFIKDWLYDKFGDDKEWLQIGVFVIAGGAKGVDSVAIDWAVENWLGFKEYPADWTRYGKRAGYIRNKQMLDEGHPDICVAFPGGARTAMMVRLARAANVKVIEVPYHGGWGNCKTCGKYRDNSYGCYC
jgi:hypothetical protein